MDDDTVQGQALVSYELDSAATIGPHQDIPIELVIRDRAGKQLRRKAASQVLLTPNPIVVHND